jgi:hypothetical protein
MEKVELFSRYELHYEPLISKFCNCIKDLPYDGMPEPHIPIIGSDYWRAKYKIAFYGIETAWWHDMSEFMLYAIKDPKCATRLNQSDLDDLVCLNWTNNPHSSFWDFLFDFLAAFYKIDAKAIREGKHPNVIRSIIWGNTNSIEKYELQAKSNNVSIETYNTIKEASRIFDNPNHLVKIAKPRVLIVLNWSEGVDWFVKEKTDMHYYKINDHIFYYYMRSSNTHIFQTHHPRSLYMRFGFKEIVEELLSLFQKFHIWETLPFGVNDICANEAPKSNILHRNQVIADIATALIKTHSVMWGQSLVDVLNRNGITQDNGEKYTYGRGIYRTISSAWNYYHNIVGDEQTAYNIAMSFVNKDGNYSY